MSHDPDDIVKVASGDLMEVKTWQEHLEKSGVQANVVGDNLSAGFGSALPGSVELWVHRSQAEMAEKLLHGFTPRGSAATSHGHPASEVRPEKARGTVHGSPPHRPI